MLSSAFNPSPQPPAHMPPITDIHATENPIKSAKPSPETLAARKKVALEAEHAQLLANGHLIDTMALVRDAATDKDRRDMRLLLAKFDEIRRATESLVIPAESSDARAYLRQTGMFEISDEEFRRVYFIKRDPDEIAANGVRINDRAVAWLEKEATPIVQNIYRAALKKLESFRPPTDSFGATTARNLGISPSAFVMPFTRALEFAADELRAGMSSPVSTANHYSQRMSLGRFFKEPL